MAGYQNGNGPSDDAVFELHEGGKLAVVSTAELRDHADLALAYTPGVAKVCSAIAADPVLATRYTWASRLVAVVSDGTAVLGLGDVGPRAALPVMEGKACLFKRFAGLDAVPVVLDTTDVDEIVDTVVRLAPSFGAVNLEDISAPRCFEIESRLRQALDLPVMHDDQHGTAIVVLAALRNAARLVGRKLADLRVVVSGAGAAGVACTRIMLAAGVGEVVVADSRGIIHTGRSDLTPVKRALAEQTNSAGLAGSLAEAMRGAEVFLGVSAGGVSEDVVSTMAEDAIIFALANPDPEIHPDVARRHASVVATGRGDFPNQINNVLAFPGVFRGAIDAAAGDISEDMKLAAADALADLVGDDLRPDRIIPSVFEDGVAEAVAAAVVRAAATGKGD